MDISSESASFAGASWETVLAATEVSDGSNALGRVCAALEVDILTITMI